MNERSIAPLVPPIKLDDIAAALLKDGLDEKQWSVALRSAIGVHGPWIKVVAMDYEPVYAEILRKGIQTGVKLALQLAAERAEFAVVANGAVISQNYCMIEPGHYEGGVITINQQSILDIEKLFV
jgi:hypothetical protein